MDYHYDFYYNMDDTFGAAFGIVYLLYYLISFGLGIAGYVLSSLGLYTIAKRRGIGSPWLAWIPVASAWIVGSISDQYRYITKGQIKNKRKALLILECAAAVLCVVLIVCIGVNFVSAIGNAMTVTQDQMIAAIMSMVLYLLVGGLAIAAVSIAALIIRCMAMYDLYTSVNPSCSVVFLVLSIIFRFTEPFFIFFNRKKDLGMPPRCDIPTAAVQPEPQYIPQPPVQEPWENVTGE